MKVTYSTDERTETQKGSLFKGGKSTRVFLVNIKAELSDQELAVRESYQPAETMDRLISTYSKDNEIARAVYKGLFGETNVHAFESFLHGISIRFGSIHAAAGFLNIAMEDCKAIAMRYAVTAELVQFLNVTLSKEFPPQSSDIGSDISND